MRLLKQAMEPKDHLKLIHGFTNDWDVVAKPQLILSDRGSIFISRHAMEVVCDRFQIFAERASPRDPEAKGQVESIFTWLTRKVAHEANNQQGQGLASARLPLTCILAARPGANRTSSSTTPGRPSPR